MVHKSSAVDLLCDAASKPPRIAAVLVDNGCMTYTDWTVPAAILDMFRDRADGQIMGLELLAILFGALQSAVCTVVLHPLLVVCAGLVTFAAETSTDNKAGECALRRGSTVSMDHNAIIHMTWLVAARNSSGVFVERVRTKDNIADDPSRCEYRWMHALGATWRKPRLPCELWSPLVEWSHV